MKAKYLLLFPALYSIHAQAQLKLPADSTHTHSNSNSLFQFFLEQNVAAKTPIINPDAFVSKMPILKPDAKIKLRTPNLIESKKQERFLFNLFKEN